jgi:hypothetical protein
MGPARPFDTVGAILSAIGLVVLVGGIMAADTNLALMAALIVLGALILAGFFVWIRRRERGGKEALLSTSLFRNRTSNLALVTQNVQWQLLMGTSFVVSAYLQTARGEIRDLPAGCSLSAVSSRSTARTRAGGAAAGVRRARPSSCSPARSRSGPR